MTDYGLGAPGVDAAGGGGFFAEDPFATNPILDTVVSLVPGTPLTLTDPLGNSLFDCRQYQGGRYFFGVKSNNAAAAVNVSMTWFDMNGSPTGQRFMILPNGTDNLGTSTGTAIFGLPHLGDQLRILMLALAGSPNPTAVNVFAAHRNSDTAIWSIGSENVIPGMLICTIGNNIGGGATINHFSNNLYAGPASLGFNISTAATTFTLSLAALDSTNTYSPIAAFSQADCTQNSLTQRQLIVPPSQLRLSLNYTGAGVPTYNLTLLADEWRAGAG